MAGTFGSTIENREERKQNSKFRKTEFLKLEGEQTIRIIESAETKHYIHYINGSYLKCLGSACPVCQNNKRILYEHPEDYREVRGWNPRRDRYYINVLDRTLSKVCPECQTVSPVSAGLCSKCGTVLQEVKPLNQVRVLNGSSRLFEDLKVMSLGIKDDNGEHVDIRAYDWVFNSRGKLRDKVTLIRPDYSPTRSSILEIDPAQLFDLERAVVTLEPDEMIEVAFKNTSVHDIFIARKAKTTGSENFLAPEKEEVAGDRELASQISEDIGRLADIFDNE
jgi:hypothetical protein